MRSASERWGISAAKLSSAALLSLGLTVSGSQGNVRREPAAEAATEIAASLQDQRDSVTYASHPPIRELPKPSDRPLGRGTAYYVDPAGNDRHDGSAARPWRTLKHALAQLGPGHTLYLRGGIYWAYGQVRIGAESSGRPGAPVTIRSYPGELAIVDFGYPDFYENPAAAWEPYPAGSAGEYRSTRSYPIRSKDASGNFGDSMVPLFRYMFVEDLRSENEHMRPGLGNRARSREGLYAGPGVFADPATGRFHIRLRHTQLPSRDAANYRGETDPRKIPLVISREGDPARFRLEGAHDVRILDLVVRGSDRATVSVRGSRNIELEGLWIYGGSPALHVNGTNVRVLHSKVRGFDAPWHSRFHDKNRSDAGRLATIMGTELEIAHNEFTDHHDGIYFRDEDRAAGNLEFHHNLVSNMNDDALFSSVKRQSGVWRIYQNVIAGCTTALAHSGGGAGVMAGEGVGNFVYRNVFDLRQHPYRGPPRSGDMADDGTQDSKLAGEHTSPSIWPPYFFYHNTVISWNGPENARTYALEMGQNTRETTRRIFNNIFLQLERLPGAKMPPPTDDFEFGGNLFWSMREGGGERRASDVYGDPRFVALSADWREPTDLRLRPDSPAIDAGVELPASWPDPLRALDQGAPDIGAFPFGLPEPEPSHSLRVACGARSSCNSDALWSGVWSGLLVLLPFVAGPA